MKKPFVRAQHLSAVRSFALAGAFALAACGASVGGPATTSRADGGGATTADGGTSSPTGASARCPALCAGARAASCGGTFNPQCVAACEAYIATLPARCSAQTNTYFACAAAASYACASDGPEVQGCDAQARALGTCVGGESPEPEPEPTDRCLPDSSIPSDIAATLCSSVPSTPVPHDCPGGAPADDCVESPQGQANVFCCAR